MWLAGGGLESGRARMSDDSRLRRETIPDKRRAVSEPMTIGPLTAELMAGRIYALGSALAASRPAIRPKIMHSALDEAPW